MLTADIGYLKSYESNRQRHNIPTMLAIDGLHKLYKTSFGPVVALRSLGLQITHALSPLKVNDLAEMSNHVPNNLCLVFAESHHPAGSALRQPF